jgi:hypothetical protein
LNDLARKKREKASKSSPEKIQPLVPKLDLSLLQVGTSVNPSTRRSFLLSPSDFYISNNATIWPLYQQEIKRDCCRGHNIV